jgi:hypothetical protein
MRRLPLICYSRRTLVVTPARRRLLGICEIAQILAIAIDIAVLRTCSIVIDAKLADGARVPDLRRDGTVRPPSFRQDRPVPRHSVSKSRADFK